VVTSDDAGEDTLVRDVERLPADALVLSTHNIWSIIKLQKDLNLPAHKVPAAAQLLQWSVSIQAATAIGPAGAQIASCVAGRSRDRQLIPSGVQNFSDAASHASGSRH